jgi:hypothetical protein
MNFIETFKKGKLGKNIGLNTGLSNLNKAINGLQKRTIIGVAAPPKCGKSKLVDAHTIIYPYLLNENADIEWIYFSYEMDRVQKEFAFTVFFLYHDFHMTHFNWKNKQYSITTDYLMGRLQDENNEPIIVDKEIEEKIKVIYSNRIVPLFGEYDGENKKIKSGKINFVENKMDADQMNTFIVNYAKERGRFVYNSTNQIASYIPDNPDKYVIIITDTLRKIKVKTNTSLKENVDSWISHSVFLRNICQYTFVHIIHTNRSLSSIERLKYNSEFIYPTGDDTKDTGNLSEECDFFLTLFNPNDEKYGIVKHFGLDLFDASENLLYPNYRSLHLVESRHTECPVHMQLTLNGATGYYEKLVKQTAAYGLL